MMGIRIICCMLLACCPSAVSFVWSGYTQSSDSDSSNLAWLGFALLTCLAADSETRPARVCLCVRVCVPRSQLPRTSVWRVNRGTRPIGYTTSKVHGCAADGHDGWMGKGTKGHTEYDLHQQHKHQAVL